MTSQIKEWDVGETVRSTVQIKVKGVLTDPGTLSFSFKSPAGVTTTKTMPDAVIVKEGVGVYSATFSLNAAGTWAYRWATTGAGAGATERTVNVRTSAFS
jgi:hypothetical protein